MRKYLLIGLVMLAALAVLVGCDDRGTGVPTGSVQNWGLWPLGQHSVDSMFTFQLKNPKELLLGTAYIPKVAMPAPTGEGRPVPVLVLLAPEGGDQYYYWQHGLLGLVQDMLSKGEIEPMVIYCVGNDPVFGGYWYGNSFPAGRYDSVIGGRLLTFLHDRLVNVIHLAEPTKLGIGGMGTGSYGAFRAVLKNPGKFGSISVTDGPLDFDGGDGNSGLIPLFSQALQEQGLTGLTNAQFRAQFDSSKAFPLSRILIGGAMAFSPHNPTLGYVRTTVGDSTSVATILDSSNIETDTMTLITAVVKDDWKWGDFHMPFREDGAAYDPIWSKWLANSLDTLYAQAGGQPLANTKIFIAHSPSAPYNYYPMTSAWMTSLNQYVVDTLVEYDYDAYTGGPQGSDPYIFDVMRKMLKFQSDCFKAAASQE